MCKTEIPRGYRSLKGLCSSSSRYLADEREEGSE
jgi:hypothetical protein